MKKISFRKYAIAGMGLALLFTGTAVFAALSADGGVSASGSATVAPSSPIFDNGGTDNEIVQLSNLTIQSIGDTSLPAVITASTDVGALCSKINAGGNFYPCPKMPDRIYNIKVTSETILLMRNRTRAGFATFAVGDKINVYGFQNQNGGGIEALIMRDLSKPVVNRYAQISGATIISAQSSPNIPATLSIRDTSGVTYQVNVSANTVLLYRGRHSAPLSAFTAGDKVNVYGWLHDGTTLDAIILRDLDKSENPNPTPTPTPVPTGDLKITAQNSLDISTGSYQSLGFNVSGGYNDAAYTITTDGSDTVPGMTWTRTPCGPGQYCIQLYRNSDIFLTGFPMQAGTYTLRIQARDNQPLPPCAISHNGGPVCMIAIPAPHTGSAAFTLTVHGTNPTPTPTPGIAPTITSLGGPTNLRVGETGTWNVTANTGTASQGSLTFSVRFGDEVVYATGNSATSFRAPDNASTGTFTHAYQNPGTYTLVFTVTNATGQQTTGTLTTNVMY